MAEWYEIDEESRTLEQKRQAWRAYHGTFLKSSVGREVLCDIQRRVGLGIRNAMTDPNIAIAQLYLDQFIAETLSLCGADCPMKLLEARSEIGGHYEPTEDKPFVPEDHLE